MSRACRKSVGEKLACCGLRLGCRLWRNERDALDDVETGAAEKAVHDGLGEPGCVVLETNGAGSLVEDKTADAVYLADAAEPHHHCFGWRDIVAVHYVQLRHSSILTSRAVVHEASSLR